MTGGGLRWAFAIAIAAYVFQACALVVWLAAQQSLGKPIPPWYLATTAQWIPVYAEFAVFFIGGLVLGRFKAFDVAINLALVAAGISLAIHVVSTMAFVQQAHSWNGTAFSLLVKAAFAVIGVWISGGAIRRP